ncbi:Zn-dependent protease (includes SpoIVFB) [Halomicrobium zhouii]|uniref:Zinc metalloprotease n=1 Tax=Halomicrobium zhouii TaxID=767519 RepID=A0A1I6K9V6_9EURY|nr:site-2 protease family protein [Halomicrobium zhouii]SFR87818.1 Zn-dependent protease (includes SpoIVFB) [Halomicrobium zhouii]
MRRFRIGSAFGIPIQLDLTFLLVLPIFAWIIGSQVTQTVDLLNRAGAGLDAAVLTTGSLPWVLGVAAAVGLFAGVVLHELGHSLVARRYGYPIDSITLWLFGGIAQLTEMPEDWRQELTIAIAGPIVSVVLGVLSYVAFVVVPGSAETGFQAARFVLGYLALMNVALAAFNLLPGFPMDGGRVLRALLARNRPFARATELAAEVGKWFAILLGLFGLIPPFNPLLIGLAFFIYIGAESESRQTVMRAAFEGVTVRDVMTPAERVTTVDPETSVSELIRTMFRERHTGYPVAVGDDVVGLVTLDDARAVRDVERDAYRVRDVMTTELFTVSPDDDVMTALTELDDNEVGRLLVLDDDRFLGLLTRTDIMTALTIIKSSPNYQNGAEESDAAVFRPQS